MRKDDLAYISHMIDLSRAAVHKTSIVTRNQYDADENLRLAVTHLIQTIGEAARRVSTDFRQQHSHIPWNQIIGMRHKVVHDYMHVDYDLVWDVASTELPRLLEQLESIQPTDHNHD
jgi:uncharacterized protein with HEPN domain